MDISRIMEKLDRLVESGENDEAKELLNYWLKDAKENKDERGELSICNEAMGLYRKLGEKDEAVAYAKRALELVESMDFEDTVTAATTYVNAGTVYKAFGEAETGLPLFAKAKVIYEKELKEEDGRLGGLYNNMGLAFLDLKKYEDAVECYKKALEVMSRVKNGNLEKCITYLNIADVCDALRNDKEYEGEHKHTDEEWERNIGMCIEKAWECISDETLPRNGYYKFVAEKCAPVFNYYGYFLFKAELEKRIAQIG